MHRDRKGLDYLSVRDQRLPEVLSRWGAHRGRAVIFDFNGTLSDDEPILLEIFDEIFGEHLGSGLTSEEYYERLAGLSDREIVERVLTWRGSVADGLVEDLLGLRAQRYREKVTQQSPIRPGTVALVGRLAGAGVPMAIVTGAQRPDVAFVLDQSPVGEHFGVVVTEEDVAEGKPDPEGFLLAARLLEREPSEILVFEDSVPGVEGALAAGMHCVAVTGDRRPRTSSGPAELAHAAVHQLGDLSQHLVLDR